MINLNGTRFGIEIETLVPSRWRFINAMRRELGTTFDGWIVTPDSSVYDGIGSDSAEIVSPILTYSDATIKDVQRIVRTARRLQAKVNARCGIHIHIHGEEVPSGRQVKNLIQKMYRVDGLLARMLNIRDGRLERFCKATDEAMMRRLNASNPETREDLAKVWYGTDDWQRRANYHYDATRYHMLNCHPLFSKNSVEFRCFNSTLHAGRVKAYIQFSAAFVKAMAAKRNVRWQKLEITPANAQRRAGNFLRNLGLSGKYFQTCRFHMMRHVKARAANRRAQTRAA